MEQRAVPKEFEVVFETKRMWVRKLIQQDVDILYKMLSDPIGMNPLKPLSREETIQWLQRTLDSYQLHKAGRYACHLKETGEFVGVCGLLFQKDIGGQDEVEVGYQFLPQFWGQGLATEAAFATMNYAREVFGYKRLISLIRPDNRASIRVAEKNGLIPEKVVIYKGHDHIVYVTSV